LVREGFRVSDPRIAKDALLAEFPGDDSILMDVEGKRYHRLNETAAFIWKALEENLSDAEITEALVRDFDVTPEMAADSVKRFVDALSQRGLIRGRVENAV
jgi:hypothetical protein